MKKSQAAGLVLALVFQFLVLGGMVGISALPLWTGTEIKIKTVPVDPRSLFRGNYARLGYEFSRTQLPSEINGRRLRNGEKVYVMLKPSKTDDRYEFDRVVLEKPSAGVFLRGRAKRQYRSASILCGIEAYFAPKEKALELEKELRKGATAVLMVASSGKARIKEIKGKLN